MKRFIVKDGLTYMVVIAMFESEEAAHKAAADIENMAIINYDGGLLHDGLNMNERGEASAIKILKDIR